MQVKTPSPGEPGNVKPWYMHRWPWFLMLGPFLVVLAGIYTTWLAVSRPDALVVDDYYKQGKAINQDLSRDRIAAEMKLEAEVRYDAAAGMLVGTVRGLDGRADKLSISLIHSTRPEKDLKMIAQPDQSGSFSIALPMLDMARWQILIEGERRDWRLNGVWAWPQEPQIALRPVTVPH